MKYNLTDMTFLVLIRLDTIERLENVLATTEFLSSNFDTNINVLECSSFNNGVLKKMLKRKTNYTFQEDYDPILYRTKYLNQMIKKVKTPFVAVWDADVIVSKNQVVDAVELLREKICF